jgi:hypothetical protein
LAVASAEPHNRGLAFNSCLRQIRALASADDVARVVAALPDDTRALVAQPPLPIEWLPYRHTFALVRTTHDLVFGGDERRTTEIARRAIVEDMKLVHKIFIRFATPQWVLTRVARLWSSYWRDNGTLRVEPIAERRVRVLYEGTQHSTPLFWAMQGATIEGLATATGLGPVTVKLVEGKDSSSRCVFEVGWSA